MGRDKADRTLWRLASIWEFMTGCGKKIISYWMGMMNKKARHRVDFDSLLEAYTTGEGREELEEYIRSHSQLPGPRGNLEMAHAFADTVAASAGGDSGRLWGLLCALAAVPAAEAPVNHPGELLPFCGAVGMGALSASDAGFRPAALEKLRALANDPRWRVREAVAQGLQRLLAASPRSALSELERWIRDENWLEMRAVAAGVAEPELLKNAETADAALTLHRQIMAEIGQPDKRRTEEFLVLRQALGYTFSVLICALPAQGFAYLRKLAALEDGDVLWILKNNLKKARLIRAHPEESEALLGSLC
jgi:hypothetical protein